MAGVNMPFVSVVMPVRNEGAYMERALKAVLGQDYPKERMEIIIADGMSTDGTREKILEIQKKYPGAVLIDNPGKIVSPGLNAAIKRAKGEIIVRVDGHCEIASDYVSRCVDHLQVSGADGAGGPIETIGETFMAQAIAIAMSSKFGVGGSAFRVGTVSPKFADTVAFPAYTREAIEKAGPYDEELVRNQDDEYNYRLRKMGRKLLLAPDIRSKYYSRASLPGLWKQYFQYGLWKVRVFQKHPGQMSARQFVPSFLIAGLLFMPQVVALVYMAALLTASLLLGARKGWKYVLVLPLIFAALHLSYGLGFLAGLIKFWNRWKIQ